MTKYLVSFRIIDGDWQYDDFDIVSDALSYTYKQLIANFYGYDLDEIKKWDENDSEDVIDYCIRDYQKCRVDDIKPITDDEIKILNKFRIAY